MNPPSAKSSVIEVRDLDSSSIVSTGSNFGHSVAIDEEIEAKHRLILIKWLNSILPSLNLPKIIKDEELRACLSDGKVLCLILNKLRPGSVIPVSDPDHTLSNPENVKRFLAATEGLELYKSETSDLEKGSIKDVAGCLLRLRSFHNSSGDDTISVLSLKSESPRENASHISLKSDSPRGNASHISLKSDSPRGNASQISLKSDSPRGNASQISLKSDSPRGNASHNSPTSGEEPRKSISESKFHRVLRSAGIGNCFYPATAPESSGVFTYQVGQKLHETHQAGHKFLEVVQHKNGSYADLPASKISEIMKSNILENASTQYLLTVVNGILDESAEKKNGEIPHRLTLLLKRVVQEIERRITTQAEYLRAQNNLFKTRDEKYQSRIRVLEALASGTREETEMLASQLKLLMADKVLMEEKKKADEEDLFRLRQEKDLINMELSTLNQELEKTKTKCSQLEIEAEGAKGQLKQKSKEYEQLLEDLINKVKELEAASNSKSEKLNMKKNQLQSAVDFQFSSLQKIKLSWESIVKDVMKEQKFYLEECNRLGASLKPLADAANKYHIVLAENRRLFNEVQELKGNIRVYCRIRPFLPGLRESQSIVEHIGENDLVVANRSKQGREVLRSFKFNKIFGSAASQAEVYADIQPFIQSVLDGYNACIFAYGQTGSGKTYTMSGPNGATTESYGVNYRALDDLFNISRNRTDSIVYEIGVQMVEIYNEQVRDLLSTDASQKRLGILTHSPPMGVAVPDASMYSVRSTSDVLLLMDIGLKNKAMGATAMNERSSRSHSVVSIHVRGKDLQSGSTLHGNLHLVDLAGSERVDRSKVTGDRLKEAQHINKSLAALGDVIFSLAQKSSHVPYRNSKLTQLLQSSLGGQAKTLMFVQLNPDVNSFSESLSTLKFAERVSGVELGAARSNKEGRDVRELMEEVASLKDIILKKDEEIEHLQSLKNGKSVNVEKASSRHGGRELIGSTPKSDHISSARRNTQSEAHSLQENEEFQFSNIAGGRSGQSSPTRADIFQFPGADHAGRLSDFSDDLLKTENDHLVDTKFLAENKRSPSHPVKSKTAPKFAATSPAKSDSYQFASADYGGRLSDFSNDDLFDNKVLSENKKSPYGTVKSKIASKVVSKVARVTGILPKRSQPSPLISPKQSQRSPLISPKRSQPSPLISPKRSQPSLTTSTVTRETMKKQSFKRSISGGQLKDSKR